MNTYVGATVHYTSRGSADHVYFSECRAAIVTEVCFGQHCLEDADWQDVGLLVANPEGIFLNRHVRHDDDLGPGTWHHIGPACNQARN